MEKSIGIEVYATHSSGLGGIIRQHAEDFVVEEVLVDGSKAETDWSESQTKHQALGSSNTKNRYLLCVMIKRNWDTFLALKAVAKQLDLSVDYIQIAGIKDAKAVTAQHITVEALRAEEILNVHVKDIEVHPIGYFHSELSSYYILGNHFHITIRAISHSKSRIRERTAETVEELKAIGGA
ncbi:tRNA pseudouridine(13) synthase TruD, partial [Candidatus Bathyarchaeota archaeon]|nr:tRNA pseudouridine(13) synthase TruD [Candidatus Bathyarchaeota archaeon]